MASIYVGSARIDERGKISGGVAGDQKQKNSEMDTIGEVSMQKFYVHSKGWYILRPRSVSVANRMAERMMLACNNVNLGYDQNQRLGVIQNKIESKVKTECDCSSLVRECIIEATGKDPGNFTTANEATTLENSQLFLKRIEYKSQTATCVYDGDVLVTKTSGHTVVVTAGNQRPVLAIPKNTLKKGSKGDNVKLLQYCLNICGANLDPDGSFGSKTQSALIQWQKTYFPTEEDQWDGKYGPKSYALMEELLY